MQVLTLVPINVTIFGNIVFKDVIKIQVRMRSFWSRVGLYSNTLGGLLRKGKKTRDKYTEKMASEDGYRDCSSTSKSQGLPAVTRS
jgi:hypothetical protein